MTGPFYCTRPRKEKLSRTLSSWDYWWAYSVKICTGLLSSAFQAFHPLTMMFSLNIRPLLTRYENLILPAVH